MPDRLFDDPRLAGIYDRLEGERDDLDHHEALIDELEARSVLDVGCGTGTLACRLARRGLTVTGVDPASASLAVARAKPWADRVRWIDGDATALPPLSVDLAIMTGNVAQVFVTDEAWAATLAGLGGAVRPGGHLVFETRDPAVRAWEGWTPDRSRRELALDRTGRLTTWHEVTDVSPPLVTFVSTFRFEERGEVLTSESTLRFRERPEIEASLAEAGFEVAEVRDAPDRPGREWVFVAVRSPRPGSASAGRSVTMRQGR